MTTLTTHEMIVNAKIWLQKQGALTPRDLLTQIRDLAAYLLLPLVPPSNIPAIVTIDLTTQLIVDYGMPWLSAQEHLTPEQFLTQLRDGASLFLKALPGPAPVPVPTPTPAPPTPPPAPSPSGAVWRAALFFPHKLYGSNTTPPWPGNQGVDSNLDFVSSHGNSWEKTKRRNGYAWVKDSGGDTEVIIAEKLRGNVELAMFLANAEHPQDGHRMNDAENEVVVARGYGINRWVVALFNDQDTSIPANGHEVYIKEITGFYDWATPEQVAWLICLETNERFSVSETIQRAEWVLKYSPGHRVIVGSAQPDFLRSVAAAAKAKGGVIELWLDTSWFPFSTNMSNADAYLTAVKSLIAVAPTWAGEFGNGKDPCVTYIRKKSVEIGVVGYTELERPSDDRNV